MTSIFTFIKNTIKELSPWKNISSLHTNIKNDILAGITVAIIALPLALAFGEISNLGPQAGIWSAIVGGIIGGLFGGCLVGVSGPTAPMASQVAIFMGAFVIGSTDQPDLTAAFSIIFFSGFLLLVFSLIKIPKLINYIPYSVISGFMCGIGFIILISQINPFLGLETKKNIHEVFNDFNNTINNINIDALYVSIPSLLIVFLWSPIEKKIKILSKIPAPLVALIVGSLIAYLLKLEIPYIGDKMNIEENSEIFSFYLPDLSRINEFILPAFSLAGLALIDSLLSCKVADNMTGYQHNSHRETFGQGLANIAAGLVGGISTATATTQTVGNITFGAKTPLATIVKGLTLLSILLGLGFLVVAIPNACLAAILLKLGFEILDYRILPILKKLQKTDFIVFFIVLFITVYKDLMIAVAVGTIFATIKSLKPLIEQFKFNYKHKIIPLSSSDLIKQNSGLNDLLNLPINLLEIQGSLFFGSSKSLISLFNKSKENQTLIINMSQVTTIDITGVFALEDLIKLSKTKNIQVLLCNINTTINTILTDTNFFENIGRDIYKKSNESIISSILEKYKDNTYQSK